MCFSVDIEGRQLKFLVKIPIYMHLLYTFLSVYLSVRFNRQNLHFSVNKGISFQKKPFFVFIEIQEEE